MTSFVKLASALLVLAESRVPRYQTDILLDLYESLSGASWSCQWNLTQIAAGIVEDDCGIVRTTHSNRNDSIEVVDELAFKLQLTGVSGLLPATLFNLTTLTLLTLQLRDIYGTLPDSIGQLTNLTFFTLSYVRLTGTLPSSLCNLHRLDQLRLTNIQLGGAIPDCLFLSNSRMEF